MRKSAEFVGGRVVVPKSGWSLLEKIEIAVLVLLAALVSVISHKLLF
jgi:hypothetical protein